MRFYQPIFEFHVSKAARDLYRFDQTLFAFNGNVILANFRAAREFAQKINNRRDLIRFPEQAVRASDINAMGLIDEILHALLEYYRQNINPQAIRQAAEYLGAVFTDEEINKLFAYFVDEFPPIRVYRGQITVGDYLAGTTDGYPNRLAVMEEIVMLWLANTNPAFSAYEELFDDQALMENTVYPHVFPLLRDFFETQPKLDNKNLLEVLQEPARVSPHSLSGQLEFLIRRWQKLIGSRFLLRVLGSLDFIKEESRIIFGTGGGGGASTQVYEFGTQLYEPEQFSPDRDWMPSLVLIAKNTYVWLDQLSKAYQRSITQLDQIPDEELDRLAKLGFTGLWLIGLWERSSASQKIKQLCGNPEAVSSAYSLYDYMIASDLGGDEAYENLRERAWNRRIRLAADMVPNHVGIYSKWVVEHPDWFIALDYSPFPGYSFNGPDLSEDSRVGIFIEDHYYSKNDAAVVFKRLDRWTGSEKYIYHGNDGTSMPWNDTAQLDYLKPEVREAVIQTIISVAKKFSVIRFDAAMTLAKKHFQRLWYPEPGSGGDIPTRAEFGLTKDQFNAAMPEEFWRQVVDRVAQEVPDTLLLAEAFWLMEGYFVRTLGMHRVYNSAFMNMLRDEKNAEYRLVVKNTLEFDPEILKRYVNFMNNPDERTAVDQFGKGDKYFGVAIMMSTMPGLPMFGHGQVEGLTEKYGMEYRKAYWDEHPDHNLVDRHYREIAPLLHKRHLFAEVNNFLLYDFYMPDGNVNEDVFAYSNRAYGEKSLVIYHNRFADTRGWILMSASYAVKSGNGDEKHLVQQSLEDGLEIDPHPEKFTIFKDQRTGFEYIYRNLDLTSQGMYFELGAYDYHVYLSFREVMDNEMHHYAQLHASLGGNGVPSIDEALRELFLQGVHQPFRELINAGQFTWIIENSGLAIGDSEKLKTQAQTRSELQTKLLSLYDAVKTYTDGNAELAGLVNVICDEIDVAMKYYGDNPSLPLELNKIAKPLDFIRAGLEKEPQAGWGVLLAWSMISELGFVEPAQKALDKETAVIQAYNWLDEWLLKKIFRNMLKDQGLDDNQVWKSTALLSILVKHQNWYDHPKSKKLDAAQILITLLEDQEIRNYLAINRYQEKLWFNKEAFDTLLWGLCASSGMRLLPPVRDELPVTSKSFLEAWKVIQSMIKAEAKSEFQVDLLLENAQVSVLPARVR
jgi:glycosidase